MGHLPAATYEGSNYCSRVGIMGRWERDILRRRARELGAAIELHYLSASSDVLFKRIERHAMEDPPITREMVTRWASIIEVPTAEKVQLFDEVNLPEQRFVP